MQKVTAYRVNRLNTVDLKQYKEGDLFLTKQSIAILTNGELHPLITKDAVQKMIDKKLGERKDGKK